ncbi:MAG: DNA polymerase [Peptostreptococcaceae bacterium]
MFEMKRSKVIRKASELRNLAKEMLEVNEFAFDTETNTLRVFGDNKDFKLVGISISWGRYHNYYIPLNHMFDENQLSVSIVVRYLKPIFEREDVTIVGANIKFDMHVLDRVGIHIKTPKIFDIVIASWICDENTSNGLKDNTQRILKINQEHFKDTLATVTKEQKKSVGMKANQKATFDMVSIKEGSPYALADSYYTWELYIHFLDELTREGMEDIYFKTYPQFLTTLYNMERRGIRVDIEKLTKMGEDMEVDLENLEYQMLEIAGVEMSLSSNQDLAQLLFGYSEFKNPKPSILSVSFGFPIESVTAKGVPQVNNATIGKLASKEYKVKRKVEGVEFCELLLEYKKLNKLKSAFVDGLLVQLYDDGKAHPSFNASGTDSGRVSCSAPNLMQLPNAHEEDKYQIRDCFIGDINEDTKEDEYIISVDYSNLEVRVMAHFSKDPSLLNAFAENKDLHGNTACMMFNLDCHPNEVKNKYPNLRHVGKVIAFLLQYGGGANTLYETLNSQGEDLDSKAKELKCKNGKEVAQKYMDMYFEGFKGIADFMKSQKKFAHRNEYVNTLVGRKRRLININSSNFGESAYNERLSINSCIQGSGADIMINAQNRIEGTNPCYVTKHYLEENNISVPFIASNRLQELDCEMLVQIHDELLFTCPKNNCEEAIGIIRDCMIYPFGENVKLNVDLEIGSGYSKSYQGGH